jgi:KaiC/GvpD/RAD55 family RecA-like ATPase
MAVRTLDYANGGPVPVPDPEWVAACDAPEISDSDVPPSVEVASRALTAAEVIANWTNEGPLVHEPTGIAKLDALTGGGPVFGSRWYLVGAPDAGKTALLVQIAHVFAAADLAVGFYAVDEEPSDIVTRLAQRSGWSREDCETRDPDTVSEMSDKLATLPIRFYDARQTIESAAADLASYRKELGARGAALFIDSVQTVTCDAARAMNDPSPRELVTANVTAIRKVASEHRLVVMATSEMNRGAYRSNDAAERTNDMAAAKESGAVEYSARVMLALRSVASEPDRVELRVVKNKHGPSGDTLHLQIDRRRMTLAETDAPAEADVAAEKLKKSRANVAKDADAVAAVIRSKPGVGERALRSELRVAGQTMGVERIEAAKLLLQQGHNGEHLVNRGGSKGSAWYLEPAPRGGES